MKKLLLFLLTTVITLTLVACNGNKTDTKVNKVNLRKIIETVELELKGLEVNTDNKKAEEIEEGIELISVEGKEESDKLLTEGKEILQKEKATQEQVDNSTNKLNEFYTNMSTFITRGTYQQQVEFNQQGLLEVIAKLNQLVKPLKIAEKAEDVYVGKKYITNEVKQKVDTVLNEVKDVSEKANETQEKYKEAIEKVNNVRSEVNSNIKQGKKPLATLDFDLNGATIKFYSHNVREDDPNDKGFKAPSGLDIEKYKREYLEEIKRLEKKYNFKLEFKQFTNPDDKEGEINRILLANPKESMIVRTSETREFTAQFTKRNLFEITDIIDFLEEKEPGKYLIGPWQREKGKILGKVFGIQRNDAVTYPDLLVFNRDLLQKYGISSDEMPDRLWNKNEWTFEKMSEIVGKINGKLEENITSLGITPYYIGINALRANGYELIADKITSEDDFKLLSPENIDILNKWSELVKNNDKNGSWYSKIRYKDLSTNYESVNKNHFSDEFGDGNFVFATIQEWQASGIVSKNIVKNFSVVPFPQMNKQDNSKYVSTIEAGDVLSVTKGENANNVAVILMLLNKWIKTQDDKRMEILREEYELPEGTTPGEILSYDFVLNKTKNSNLMDKKIAIKIAAFIHGYKLNDENDFTYVAKGSKLPQVGIDGIYARAIQDALYKSSAIFGEIKAKINEMKFKYEEIVEVIKEY